MTEIITIAEDHSVSYSSGAFVLNLTIDNQNAVDRIEFVLPESVGDPADWAWRVEIEQDGQTSFVALADDVVWIPRAGAVTYGKCELQLVGVQPSGEGYNRVYKSRVFKANVLPAINAKLEAGTEAASAIDEVLLKVEGYKDAAAQSAQDAAGSAASASEAQGKAEDAQTAAETAQGKAEDAQTAAEAAQNSAETARDAAQTAQRAAETARDTAKSAQSAAEAARDAASGSAQGAASSAIVASDSAEDAQGYADDAQSSAQDAQTSAGNAQTAAGQAAGSATTAQGHAQTAQQAAQTAQDAAQALSGIGAEAQTLPPGSDATVTVQDGKIIYGIPAGQPGTGLPDATAEDAGKVPVVGADGGYALGDPVPQVDDTLTQAGAPADAKAAGDAIAAITPDDNSVGDKPWSSKQIIDVLCPPLEETGNPVQCYPVAGYPLGVKASWEPRQEGEGDPLPENIRPITGLDEVTVTLSDGMSDGTTATLDLPSTVYGGEVDLATGEGVETFYSIVLNGTEDWMQNSGGNFGLVYFQHQIPNSSALLPSSGGNIANAKQSQVISHFMIGNPYSENVDNAGFVYNTESVTIATVRIRASQFENTDDWKTYLSAQHSAGTPVTIAYKLATPIPITATPSAALPALSGQNVLITNADSLTVTGRADPNHTIQTLSDRIAALESEMIEGGTNA